MQFYELTAWQESHKLVISVYKVLKNLPSEENFALKDQLRRAVTSITANIAEGTGRYHYKDKTKFYYLSRGSLKEVQNFLIVCKDLDYLTKEIIKNIWDQTIICDKLINGLIKSAQM